MALKMNNPNINKENDGHVSVFPKKMYPNSARKCSSVKKQAFGELKNVMHNQIFATPMKPTMQQSISNNNRKEHNTLHKAKNTNIMDIDNLDLIDYSDDRTCCKEPLKSVEEIWDTMNMMDDSYLNHIISEDTINSNCNRDFDDNDDFNNVPYIPDSDNHYENDNLVPDDTDANTFTNQLSTILDDSLVLDVPELPDDLITNF